MLKKSFVHFVEEAVEYHVLLLEICAAVLPFYDLWIHSAFLETFGKFDP